MAYTNNTPPVKNETLTTAATTILAACALLLTASNVRESIAHTQPPPPVYTVPDWRAYAAVGHRDGPFDSKVTITMFSDYQCGACKAAMRVLNTLRQEHPTSVAVVLRHFPLPGHPNALATARAAVCAAEQGKFKEFHEVAFENSDSLDTVRVQHYATQAGVPNQASFAACLASERPDRAVNADVEAARKLGVLGTPTVLVNQDQYLGVKGLKKIVRRHLSE